MSTQPEALRLAECLEEPEFATFVQMKEAAAELRRLHEVNQELLEALEYWAARDEFNTQTRNAIAKAKGSAA
jgi:hypothetical protein